VPKGESLNVSGKKTHSRLKWVSDIIDPRTRKWDEGMIRRICYEHDAETILRIKLPVRHVDDFVAWHCEPNGIFSVRSAYRLGMRQKLLVIGPGQSSSAPDGDRKVWDVIWKCQVPQKLRVFTWRLATNSLAVMVNVNRRIHTVLPNCIICGGPEEDEHHAVIGCTLARALRDGLRNHWVLPSEYELRKTGREWVIQLLVNASKEMRVKIVFMFWRAWHHRNNIVHGDGKASVAASVPYLVNYAASYASPSMVPTDIKGKASISPIPAPLVTDEPVGSIWKPPLAGWIKVNVDAGWDASSKRAGTGVVIRDEEGKVLLTAWEYIPECGSVLEAELLACLHGLKFVENFPQKHAILETDCALAIRAINEQSTDRSESWTIIREIVDRMEFLHRLSLEKISRNGNSVAHSLCQLGKRESNGCLRESAPSCVSALIAIDCNNVVI
jgi:ribonuclease HI